MKIIRQTVPENFNLFLFGDKHEGSIMSHQSGWETLLHMMNSSYKGVKSNFGWESGDEIEAILVDDPRYDIGTSKTDSILKQMDQAVADRAEMKGKLIGMNLGNHPDKLKNFGNITEEICNRLGITYGTWTSKITYVTKKGKLLFKHFATHGAGTVNSNADDPKRRTTNMELALKRKLKFMSGDAVLNSMGHTHKLLICKPDPELYIVDNGKELKQKYTAPNPTAEYIHPDLRWYINTGSFYKLFGDGISGYGEKAGYAPVELGFAIVRVRNGAIEGIDKIVV